MPHRPSAPIGAIALLAAFSYGAPLSAYVNPYTGMQYQSWSEAGMFTALSQMQQDNAFYLSNIDVLGGRRGESSADRQPSAPEPSAPKPAEPIAATDFRPEGPRRVVEEFAALLGEAGDVELLRTLHGAIDGMDGFRRHNLAYAMAFALYASLQVGQGRTLDEAQQYALIERVNDFLVRSGAYAQMSARARTDAYDYFVLVGALITSLDDQGRKLGDRSMRDGAKVLATSTLDAFGLDR